MEPNKEAPLPEYYPQKEYTLLPFSNVQNLIPNFPMYIDPSQNPNSDSNFQNMEKVKRHRRGKNEINDRNYRCPDCDKCYLSGPALTTHRKTKHGYGINGEVLMKIYVIIIRKINIYFFSEKNIVKYQKNKKSLI